ncbi:MAG: hypothetical protein ACTHMB_14250 [Candidatus Binatia bacterium]
MKRLLWCIRSLLFFIASVAGIGSSEAQAQQVHRWITRELANGSYRLSEYEENGLYYCSSAEQKIVDTKFENGYALPDLLKKLQAIELDQFYNVLCVHSFFRDDWQNRYDEDRSVSDRLLDIKKQEKQLVGIP